MVIAATFSLYDSSILQHCMDFLMSNNSVLEISLLLRYLTFKPTVYGLHSVVTLYPQLCYRLAMCMLHALYDCQCSIVTVALCSVRR